MTEELEAIYRPLVLSSHQSGVRISVRNPFPRSRVGMKRVVNISNLLTGLLEHEMLYGGTNALPGRQIYSLLS